MALTSQQLYASFQAWMGQPTQQQMIANYTSPTTFVGGAVYSTVASLAAGASTSVNLASLFPAATACQLLVIQDLTATPGAAFSAGFGSGALVAIKAGAGLIVVMNGGTPPTVWITAVAAGQFGISVVST